MGDTDLETGLFCVRIVQKVRGTNRRVNTQKRFPIVKSHAINLSSPHAGQPDFFQPNTSVEPSRERLRCSRSMTFLVILNESVSPIR